MAFNIHSGSWLGLPDLGITETIGNIFNRPTTSQGGSNLIGARATPSVMGASTSYQAPQGPMSSMYAPYAPVTSGGTTQKAAAGGTGGVGGGAAAPAVPSYQDFPYEQAPQQPSINYDAIFSPVLNALGQYESTLQPQYETALGEIEAGKSQRVGQLKGEESKRLGELEQQRGRESQRTESAVSEARRQASELSQGIQARYGATTGTGAFANQILGSQAMRNIAQNRAAFQEVSGQINSAAEELKNQTANLVQQEESQAELAKERARNEFQSAMASINQEKGRLESDKARMRVEGLMNYQNLVSEINARNAQMKQQLYLQAQEAEQRLANYASQAQQQYAAALSPAQYTDLIAQGAEPGSFQQQYVPEQLRGVTFGQGEGSSEEDQLLKALGL